MRANGVRRILVVDDDAGARTAVADALLDFGGYTVEEAVSGKEALEIFRRQPLDLVITDFNMPGMTGIELARQILSERPEIGIILLTGYVPDLVAREAREVGIAAVFSKPPRWQDLDEAIRRLIG